MQSSVAQRHATESVDAALAAVLRPGQRIAIGQGHGAPRQLISALARHLDRLRGSQLLVGLVPDDLPELPGVDIMTFFPAGPLGTTAQLAARNGRYLRRSLFTLAEDLRTKALDVNVALGQATLAPDGSCSLGRTVDFLSPAVDRADAVVLEIAPDVPWTGPRSTVSLDDRVRLVRCAGDPVVLARPAVDGRLGQQIARWIPDHATIELGMGRWVDGLAGPLSTRHGLRVHTGMIGDWLVDLLHHGSLAPDTPITATAVGGDRDLWRTVSELDTIDLAPAYLTHDPRTLAGLPRFRAVNSVFEVDLLGQGNSEIGFGGRIGGIGGLADFARGASENPDGLSIVALSASAGPRSRIVARLDDDRVSLGTGMIDVVVTEHGSADLRERSPAERAAALIAVAEPDHRDALRRAARELESER